MIHYYIKSLSKKVVLPLALAAGSLTPALADTTISIQGPTDNNIAFDETEEIAIVMNSTDNVSGVDLKVALPAGLEFIELEKKVSTHSYKVEQTAEGFHVMLWNDGFVAIPNGETTLATFKVKANTQLVDGSVIDLTIVDVRDVDNVKVSTKATVTDIDSDPISVDKSKLPGTVIVSALDGDDTPSLVMDGYYQGNMKFTGSLYEPTGSLFTPQTVAITLENSDALVSDMQAVLRLPVGLSLTEKGVWVNEERQVPNKMISVTPYVENGVEVPGAYQIIYSGGLEPFNLKEGPLFFFEVQAGLDLASVDQIVLTGIIVTDIHSVHAPQNDIVITVENLNQQAYEALLAPDGKKGMVDAKSLTAPYDRVYDYSAVLTARDAANEKLMEEYNAGVLDINIAEVEDAFDTYEAAIDDATEKNEALHDAAVTQYTETLPDALEAATNKPAPSRAQNAMADETGYRVNIDNNVPLANKYAEAEEAIAAYQTLVENLYDQTTEEDATKYDGALLTDSEGENLVAQALAAAEQAIQEYAELIVELNNQNDANEASYLQDAQDFKDAFDALVEANEASVPELIFEDTKDEMQAVYTAIQTLEDMTTALANEGYLTDAHVANMEALDALKEAVNEAIQAYNDEVERLVQLNNDNYAAAVDELADAEEYIKNLPNDDSGTLTGAYANWENFPELKEALDDAAAAIEEAHDKGALAFEDGVNAIEEAIAAVIELADAVKAANDAAFAGEQPIIDQLNEAVANVQANEETASSEAFAAAAQAAVDAIDAYEAALNASNEKGMVAKDLANEESELSVAKAAAEEAVANLYTVTDNLNALNDKIDAIEAALQDAKDELEEIRNADEYKYIDSSEKTAEDMAAIDQKVADLEAAKEALDTEINDATDWEALLNENGEVDAWHQALDDLLDAIDGEDGLDSDIDNAVEKYDFYHKRGDANMDGKVSMIDYNIILQYVREELAVADATPEMISQLNVVQEKSFGTDIEINITDAIAALWIYLNEGSDEGLGLGERYYSARADEAERLTATTQMVNGVRRIALNLNNVDEYTAAQLDVVLPEGMKLVGAQLGSRAASHTLFVGNENNGHQRIVISSSQLEAFQGNEGAVLYIDVEGAGDVEFQNVIFSTTHAVSAFFTVGSGEATGIASVKEAAEGEQVYSIGGRMMNALKKGINIIRRADGTTQKVIKK